MEKEEEQNQIETRETKGQLRKSREIASPALCSTCRSSVFMEGWKCRILQSSLPASSSARAINERLGAARNSEILPLLRVNSSLQ